MASWYNNILTKTTSQISSLRSTLLSSDADGDTEDDTHVCRVLRNYYSDKGRPFPPWLPPDPKAAAPPPAQTLYSQPQVGSRYGGLGQQQQQGGGGPGSSGALSSLWDSGPAPQQQQQQSLRAGRLAPNAAAGVGPAGRMGGGGGRDDAVMPRPLPSQRAGSYQSATAASPQPTGASAQDRLRQRLWGGSSSRTSSPSQSATGSGQQGPFQPPSANSVGGGSSNSKSSKYEDRFAPSGSYDSGRGGGGGGAYMGANAPWSSGGGEYGGGGGGSGAGGGAGGGGRQGLPSGPRRQGLPSGPRGYR
ncbi:hypothetical protein JDV02_004879 [Purpureocillium takamizusanense]|uniref:Mso1 N-terminal domain-containing protein n=1 Tax=Purpureocillium takamizusanense TaxID=2060973 RepID=A0A9Q8QDB0_9HYPO|nr:uncharacterized protein JDV02_004879 [Purpureocillium takamizusanense]UNI18624.1 hypothetical protein JDV02_004879 [Purpureocillium takamizusanense]